MAQSYTQLNHGDDAKPLIKKKRIGWDEYERRFNKLIEERMIENLIEKETLAVACLLCSEAEPDYCHRRLVAEYFEARYSEVVVVHL